MIRPDRPYITCEIAIALAWMIGMCGSLAIGVSDLVDVQQRLLLIVGVGSGLIALAAGIPGVITDLLAQANPAPERLTIGFSAGVIIRLLGTVALLGLCSYHLPAASKQIAGTILAWYIYLTMIDVAILAMLLPRQDKSAAPESFIAKRSNP